MRRPRRTAVALGALAALALAPAAARADTIVFQRAGDLWLMQPDGSGSRQITHGEHKYAWPSEADDGTIVAVDDAGAIYRMSQKGAAIGAPLPSPATQPPPDVTAEPPTHVRVAPDGRRIAYDEQISDEATTLWTPFGATALEFPGQSAGQEELEAPSWIGSSQLLLSRDVAALGTDTQTFALYGVGGGDDSATGWFSDTRTDWASGFEAVASRSGKRLVVLADDSADFGGFPRRVELRVLTAPAPGQPPQVTCDIALPAEDTFAHTSPTFSPDGNRLAWAESDGIHVVTLGALTSCDFKEDVITEPGAWEPYWSPADDVAPPAGGGGPAGGGSRLTLRVVVKPRPHRATLLRAGVGARVSCSAACALRITLRLDVASAKQTGLARVVAATARKLTRAGTVKVHLRLRPNAQRALRKLAAFRLTLRVTAPGATRVSRVLRPR